MIIRDGNLAKSLKLIKAVMMPWKYH